MNKNHIILFVTLAVLAASCSKDEPLTPDDGGSLRN